jgi:hypothetical protein
LSKPAEVLLPVAPDATELEFLESGLGLQVRTAAGPGPRSTDDLQFKPSGALPPAHFLPRARLGGAVALLDRSAGRGDRDDLGAGARRVCAGERRHVIPRLGSTQRQPPTRACRSGPPLPSPFGGRTRGADEVAVSSLRLSLYRRGAGAHAAAVSSHSWPLFISDPRALCSRARAPRRTRAHAYYALQQRLTLTGRRRLITGWRACHKGGCAFRAVLEGPNEHTAGRWALTRSSTLDPFGARAVAERRASAVSRADGPLGPLGCVRPSAALSGGGWTRAYEWLRACCGPAAWQRRSARAGTWRDTARRDASSLPRAWTSVPPEWSRYEGRDMWRGPAIVEAATVAAPWRVGFAGSPAAHR